MAQSQSLSDVAQVIQLAVAPVFLLTSVGTILNVLSTRLSRVIDRARVLGDRMPGLDAEGKQRARAELQLLQRRRQLVNMAITFGTVSALFVCLLIAAAFIASMLEVDASLVVAALFVLSMASLIGALLFFLSEIVHAVSGTPIEPPK
jgi:predicted MFS family arabinose efflux permease